VFLGLLPLLLLAGGLAYTALRRVASPPPDPAEVARHRTGARLLRAIGAALGAGLLIAGLGTTEPLLFVGGVVAGLAMLLPSFRWLTPRGTLLLAVGVPAAVFLRAVMTFAFFSADAFIPLLLQEWRGTPAFLTGIVFTVTTVAWTAATWIQARRIDHLGPRWFTVLGFGLMAVGALATIPTILPGVPPELAIVTWALPGLGMGFMYSAVTLVVLRGTAAAEQGSASSSIQLADILGTALGTGVAGAITAAGERAGPDGLGIALGAVFAMSLVVSLLGLVGARRLGAVARIESPQPAAVD
jgi:hypothetical protein